MNVFTYELKKTMLSQRGLLWLLAFLLLSTAALVSADTPQTRDMEEYRSEYEWYLNRVSGPITTETSAFLDAEAESIAQAKTKRQQLMEDYYNGKLSQTAYQEQDAALAQVLARQKGFDVIYQQYLYISEAPERRYFVQTNGWAGLLGNGTLDIPLLIAILVISVPAFCGEYRCQMDALITTAAGGQKSAKYKLLIVLGTVLLLCLTQSLLRLGFFALKYGLPHGDCPIQSLPQFGSGTKRLSLWGGYAAITLFRCCGGLYLAVLLLLFSVMVKKYALTMLLGAASTLLPYMGLPGSVLYRSPLPLPFLLGNGFLRGSVYDGDSPAGTAAPRFREVTGQEFAIFLAVSAVVCLAAVCWILHCNSNQWQSGRRRLRFPAAATLGMAFLFLLSGCTAGTDREAVSAPSMGEEYQLVKDPSTQRYHVDHSATGTVIELPMSPLFGAFSDSASILSCYLRAPYVYYAVSQTEQYVDRIGSYNSSFTKVSVLELDLETFEERVIFEKITDSGRTLLGIDYEAGDKWMFLQYHTGLFVNQASLFFVGSDGVTQVDRATGHVRELDIPTTGTVAFDGRQIFFLNAQSVLIRFDTQDGASTAYEQIVAYDFYMDKNAIYYINRMDSNYVYRCTPDGADIRMVSDIPATAVSCDGEVLHITTKQDGTQIEIPKPIS